MNLVLDFYTLDEPAIADLLKNVFNDKKWLESFFRETHHGLEHGNQVKTACLKFIEKLNNSEKQELVLAGEKIDPARAWESALTATSIAAVFHDSGRINNDGLILGADQVRHHIVSAERAETFCLVHHLQHLTPFVSDAVLSHDFQNPNLTPHLNPPQTIIGKIVQSADQVGWFHPGSVYRTMNFCKSMGVPMYDPSLSLQERLDWVPANTEREDALTVVLNQLFGPTDEQRFGIECARQKIETYKADMEQSILKAFGDIECGEEAERLVENFRIAKTLR
ncbi:MAG: hypothetical protein WCW31_00870 [Patescibacteria group bacterium]|jgi:hypothetical protein